MVLGMDFYLQHNSLAKGSSNARSSKNIPKTCSAISEFHEGQVLTPGTIATTVNLGYEDLISKNTCL
jgi:hypothetical protein